MGEKKGLCQNVITIENMRVISDKVFLKCRMPAQHSLPELRLQFAGLGDKVLPNRVAALWAENQKKKISYITIGTCLTFLTVV